MNFPGLARKHATGFVIAGKAYLGPGDSGSGPFYNDLWEYTPGPSSIDEAGFENSVSVYPNPSSGIFSIQSTGKILMIEIMNVLGEKIYSEQINADKKENDLFYIPKGIYFIHLISERGNITKKIIFD